jgi:hypothetical protein
MVSDRSVEELLAFASEIGLRRRWLQDGPRPHYDLRPSKRRLTVSKEASSRGWRAAKTPAPRSPVPMSEAQGLVLGRCITDAEGAANRA